MFCQRLSLKEYDRILDLGGSATTWAGVEMPLRITILNLPGHTHRLPAPPHEVTYVEGDACDVAGFSPGDFDIIFSNSVIEHVGPYDSQLAFAEQVRKFRTRYWVQTPALWFPIEAHCGMPFWWFYPESLRRHFIGKWRERMPAWAEMVEGTRCLRKSQLKLFFPDAKISTERYLGISKSYIAWKS